MRPVAEGLSAVVATVSKRFEHRDEDQAWAACAAVWGLALVEAKGAWLRWPPLYVLARNVSLVCFDRGTGRASDDDLRAAVATLGAATVPEDDGSQEWGRALTVVALLDIALKASDGRAALTASVTEYLNQVAHECAMRMAAERGGSVSQAGVEKALQQHAAWRRATEFTAAL